MTYYNKYTSEKSWIDLKEKTKKGTSYVLAPNPGRSFSITVALISFLKYVLREKNKKEIKEWISQGNISVNGNVVKQEKHPVAYGDYMTIKEQEYQVWFTKSKKVYDFKLEKLIGSAKIYPVKRWFLHKGKCLVNTLQNKIFAFEPCQKLYSSLRELDAAVIVDKDEYNLIKLSVKCPISLVKLTGKDKYQAYTVQNLSNLNQFYEIELIQKNKLKKLIKIHKLDFKKKYVFLPLKNE